MGNESYHVSETAAYKKSYSRQKHPITSTVRLLHETDFGCFVINIKMSTVSCTRSNPVV